MASKFLSFFKDIFDGITDTVSDIFGFGKNVGDAIDTAVNGKDHGFKFDNNGFASFSQSDWDLATNGLDDEAMRYVNEWNTSLKQYEQQYGLQKDAFDFNKQMQTDAFDFNKQMQTDAFEFNKFMAQQSFDYNKALSERQQALSEDSYRNGVINQAKQLARLGINPASSGGTVTPMSMSGGSSLGNISLNAGSLNSGSLNSGSTGSTGIHSSITNKKMLQLQMLNYLTQLRKTNSEIRLNESNAKVNESNAEVNRFNSETSRMSALSGIKVNESSIKQLDSLTSNNIARTSRQLLENDDYSSYLKMLSKFGISDSLLQAMKNVDWQVALACGITSFVATNDDNLALALPSVDENISKQQFLKSPDSEPVKTIQTIVLTNSEKLISDVTSRFLEKYPYLAPDMVLSPYMVSRWVKNNYSVNECVDDLYKSVMTSRKSKNSISSLGKSKIDKSLANVKPKNLKDYLF